MKKVLAFLLVLMMLVGMLPISIFAVEATVLGDGNTDCTCGGSYGEWFYPEGTNCVGGRYERVCGSCGNKQTAKDITAKTVSYTVPAIGANVGDIVMLSLYDVYFTSSTVKSAKDIVWSSEDIEIVNNQICPGATGTYKLTATAGTSTKSVYLVVKNPTDTEYVLFFDDFNRDTNGDGKVDASDERIDILTKDKATDKDYMALEKPSGTEIYIQNGKLVLNALGNSKNQMRVLLPAWVGDFGDYEIDTVFTMNQTQGNDNSRWFAVTTRSGKNGYSFWQAAVRQGALSQKKGVEIANRSSISGQWDVTYSGKYTEDLLETKPYTLSFNISGNTATYSINDTVLFDSETVKYLKDSTNGSVLMTGGVGFQVSAAKVTVDSVKIVVPIDDSIHNFSNWTTVTVADCLNNGLEKRECVNCGEVEERVVVGGHTAVQHALKMPTCTENGWQAYETCSVCDYTTFGGEIAAFGHCFEREFHSIAHRGYSDIAPENTLPAYRLAKQYGFYYAECDIVFTLDGVAVLNHDNKLDNVSTGTGKVTEKTYEELLQYDFGSWKSEEYAGTKIATFEEFIALCAEIGLHPYIELKDNGGVTQERVNELVAIVEKYGMLDNCTWIAFSHVYLGYVKKADSTARLGYLNSSLTTGVVNTAINLRNGKNEVFLDINCKAINNSSNYRALLYAIERGVAIEAWTVDDEQTMRKLPKYISGVASNKLYAEDYFITTEETAPTCTEQGYTTYTCACGEEMVADYVPVVDEHTYENGVCTGCGEILYCADPSHNLQIISISYENGYDKVGVKIVKCLDCNASETVTEAPALYACVGYAMSENGSNSIAVGFEVNNKAIEEYEAVTGKTLEIGVVFAGYDNLAGKQPLDENGKAVSLDVGKVVKADLSGFEYQIYDFVLTDIDDSIKDVKLVIAAYIYDGEGVSYLQESGAGGTVSGVSYNEVMERIK